MMQLEPHPYSSPLQIITFQFFPNRNRHWRKREFWILKALKKTWHRNYEDYQRWHFKLFRTIVQPLAKVCCIKWNLLRNCYALLIRVLEVISLIPYNRSIIYTFYKFLRISADKMLIFSRIGTLCEQNNTCMGFQTRSFI